MTHITICDIVHNLPLAGVLLGYNEHDNDTEPGAGNMDYGKILKRGLDIIWDNKILLLLGLLVTLGRFTGRWASP